MNTIILLPLFLYTFLLAINMDLLSKVEKINLFWVSTPEIHIFLFTTIFIIAYIILIFFVYDGLNSYLRHKVKKMEDEIVVLKSKLFDGQKGLIEKINTNNEHILDDFKKENIVTLEKHEKDTDKILDKLNLVDKNILDKIKTWKIKK